LGHNTSQAGYSCAQQHLDLLQGLAWSEVLPAMWNHVELTGASVTTQAREDIILHNVACSLIKY
jgi:hypothetical protein